MQVIIREGIRKGESIEIPDGWQCTTVGYPVEFGKKIHFDGRGEVTVIRRGADVDGLEVQLKVQIQEADRGGKVYRVEDRDNILASRLTLSEAKIFAESYLKSWQGNGSNGLPVIWGEAEIKTAYQSIVNKKIIKEKSHFDFGIKTITPTRGGGLPTHQITEVPALPFGGLVLHRDLGDTTGWTITHRGTTMSIVTCPTIEAVKKVVRRLDSLGIDWTVDDHDEIQYIAREKGLGSAVSELRGEGLLC